MNKNVAEFDEASREVSAAAELQPIALRSLFWRPNWLEPSEWMEHIPFAFWLVEAHRPKVIVELGTGYGTSYFAFCQAVDRLSLGARCFAVDTWNGDEDSGFCGEEALERVRMHNDAQYSGFSRLIRSSFDVARQKFSDGSIDLLHIGGPHSLEAVTREFESWLPKLSDRAVVILHNTNVREVGFGVYKLFEQLKTRYPAFEFIHGHGLGVLGVGKVQNQMLQQLFLASGREDAQWSIRDVFARLGRSCTDAFLAQRQQLQVRELSAEIDEYKQQIEITNEAFARTKNTLETQAMELAESKRKLQMQLEEQALVRGQLAGRLSLLQEIRVELKEQLAQTQLQAAQASAQRQLEHDAQQSSSRAGAGRAIEELAHRQIEIMAALQSRIDGMGQELHVHNSQQAGKIAALESELSSSRNAAPVTDTRQLEAAKALNAQIVERQRAEIEALTEAKRRAEESTQSRFSESAELSTKFVRLQEKILEKESVVGELQQQMQAEASARQVLEAQLARSRSELQTYLLPAQVGLEEARQDIERLRSQLETFERSRLWKLLAPVRYLRRMLRPRRGGAELPASVGVAMAPVEDPNLQIIRQSSLFDRDWYFQRYPDVAASGIDPVAHYLHDGAKELRDPGPEFSTQAYLSSYPDVAESGLNPLVHYLEHGCAEGRDARKSAEPD